VQICGPKWATYDATSYRSGTRHFGQQNTTTHQQMQRPISFDDLEEEDDDSPNNFVNFANEDREDDDDPMVGPVSIKFAFSQLLVTEFRSVCLFGC
jgi:hypothetical protein